MNKNTIIAAIAIGGVALVTVVLVLLAQGGVYEIKTADPSKGLENSQIVIEEFADFQCPACAANAPVVAQVMEEYGDRVKFVYRDFPLPSHPKARPAAIAAICAAQQDKFFEYHDGLYADQQTWSAAATNTETYLTNLAESVGLDVQDWQSCRDSRDARREVEADVQEGMQREVNATPTFFLNGEKISAPGTFFTWKQLLDVELEREPATVEGLE